jgi:hypothetical protein
VQLWVGATECISALQRRTRDRADRFDLVPTACELAQDLRREHGRAAPVRRQRADEQN